jgi:hypothetical protein
VYIYTLIGGAMKIEEAMLYFRVLFDQKERIDQIINEIEIRIPEHDRFCSSDKHEWYIHNRYRKQFGSLVNQFLGKDQLSLF